MDDLQCILHQNTGTAAIEAQYQDNFCYGSEDNGRYGRFRVLSHLKAFVHLN